MASISSQPDPSPPLDTKRHTKYFLRCLKTYLPHPYTSNDSNRLSLAFFIIAALDILDQLVPNTTSQERAEYIDWVYANQHPEGGFRGFPGSDLGISRNEDNADWDPAHVPGTYFALCLLLILEDDFARFKREECLRWLAKLQREDGSFGETLMHGVIQGGRDARFGYCAAGIRYILTGTRSGDSKAAFNVDKLVECIQSAESYDGGISDVPFNESHAGLTFCGVAACSFLGRLSTEDADAKHQVRGPSRPAATIRFLVSRQTTAIADNDTFDIEYHAKHPKAQTVQEPSFVGPTGRIAPANTQPADDTAADEIYPPFTGMNGRWNKVADTCYAFWVIGSLKILGRGGLPCQPSMRRWLLERTAHPALGGFGKIAGDLPDVYHSYLALTVLSMMNDPADGLLALDATMCISARAKARLQPLWVWWGITDLTVKDAKGA